MFLFSAVDVSKRSDSSIQRIFLDPTGRHLIVSMTSSETFYLGRNNKKLKSLPKIKASLIVSSGRISQNIFQLEVSGFPLLTLNMVLGFVFIFTALVCFLQCIWPILDFNFNLNCMLWYLMNWSVKVTMIYFLFK